MPESGDTILVLTADQPIRRTASKALKVEVLAENVNLFLTQIDSMMTNAPKSVGDFRFSELTVSVEISAKGQLILLGTGGEAGLTGALTFKFSRRPGEEAHKAPTLVQET
jgi:hypothetical protein